MGLLRSQLNPNSCKVWVSLWHKGRVLPTHTVTGVAMTEWGACLKLQGCLPVPGCVGSKHRCWDQWDPGGQAGLRCRGSSWATPCSPHGPAFSHARQRPQPMVTLWQGLGALRVRVLDRLISSANCSSLGLLSCYLWSGHFSVKLHLPWGCISFSFAFPLHGAVGGCVHFLLVLLAIHLPGTKNP